MVTPPPNMWDVSQCEHSRLHLFQRTRLQTSAQEKEVDQLRGVRKDSSALTASQTIFIQSPLFWPSSFTPIFTLNWLPVLPVPEILDDSGVYIVLFLRFSNWQIRFGCSALLSDLLLIHLPFRSQIVVSFPILVLVKFVSLNGSI